MQNIFDIHDYDEGFLERFTSQTIPIYDLWSVRPLQNEQKELISGGSDDADKFRDFIIDHSNQEFPHPLVIVIGNAEKTNTDRMSNTSKKYFKLKFEKFDIVKLVEDIFETDEMLAKMFNIKLEFDGNYPRSIKVKGDKARIAEAVGNLIGNSIKYGKNNGKTKVKFTEEDKHIMVEISDNGIGINQEDLPRIFERFFRVDKSRSRDSGGTGLGLSIVKHVIQAHKQTIDVSSNPGKGTVFLFSLDKG